MEIMDGPFLKLYSEFLNGGHRNVWFYFSGQYKLEHVNIMAKTVRNTNLKNHTFRNFYRWFLI